MTDGKTRRDRGQIIAKRSVHRLDDHNYKVDSQTMPGKQYDVVSTSHGWRCSCPDHTNRHVICKHMHAVEISMGIRNIVKNVVRIKPVDLIKCKFCNSDNIIKKGIRKLKRIGHMQQFGCRDCNRRFVHNPGFEKKQSAPEQIILAINLVFSGLSSRSVSLTLRTTGTTVTHRTVQNWAKWYSNLMYKFLDTITPQVGEKWRTDELYLKIRGEKKYLFAMIDSETRFWLAKMVADHKGIDDVLPLFVQAKQTAGKVPETLISDGAANFSHAHKKVYATKNDLHKKSEHIRHVHLAGDTNNNQMESFNGNTIRNREKIVRGLKKCDSAILTGLHLFHNYIRPHQGLNGQTPGEAAGIIIEGNNKWMTIIQNAAKYDYR